MTSTNNLADIVRHYQRNIERHGEDETRLLHCITKLFNLPITFEHLQETGIGKTVNALRKINGEVGVAAKTLVTKWKAMVAAEEEPTAGQHSHPNGNEEDSNRSNGRRSSDEDQDQENKGSNSSSGCEDTRSRHSTSKSKHHDERRSKTDEHKSKSSSSSSGSSSKHHSSKSRHEEEKKHRSSSHDKTSTSSKERKSGSSGGSSSKSKDATPAKSNSNHKSSSHESSKQSHHSNHKSEHSKSSKHDKSSKEDKSKHSDHKSTKEKSSEKSEKSDKQEKSEKHKSSSSSASRGKSSSKRGRSQERPDDDSPKEKKPKSKPSKVDATPERKEETADGFDSSMGANFDDVLGMLNMPMSGKKIPNRSKSCIVKATVVEPAPTKTNSVFTAPSGVPKRNSITPSSTTSASPAVYLKPSTKKPELLASSAKLEPLDPSIALELPTIPNNYRPMPLNQTVMDVVFNHGASSCVNRATRMNESEALAAGTSSRTMRTKIYSGVRTGQILQVPSLFDLCIRVLQKNIDALEFTGGVPFDLLRPVLERATPQQLLNIEEYNAYLMEDTDILWQQHVHRQHRAQKREEMETWREMFLRCEEQKERKLSTLAESIKASQKISEAPVRKTQLAFVDSMVKPPRGVMRKQEIYGTKGKLIATPAARVAALSQVTPNAAKVGDARLRVLNAAKDTAQLAVAPIRNKKAPLMAKTLQFMRGRHKR